MKTSFKSVLSIMISIIVITYITSYTTSSRDLNAEQMEEPVNYQQLKGQVDYFKQAIDELGVTSPLEAAISGQKVKKQGMVSINIPYHVTNLNPK